MKNSSVVSEALPPLVSAARVLVFASVLVPVALLPGFFFPYITVRAVFFRVLVELATAIVLYLLVRRNASFNFRGDTVFWALAAWVAANAIAAAFGAAPIRSFFGDHERMGGVWFWVHLLAYYVVLRTVLRPRDWWRFLQGAVGVAAVIAAYGLAEYWFGPFRFGVGGLPTGSTVGNPGLLAIYLLANVAICALLVAHSGLRLRWAYSTIGLMLIVAIVLSGNRSSALALLVGSAAGLLGHTVWSRAFRGWRALAILGVIASAAALPFISRADWARPATSRLQLLSKLSSGVDSTRVIQWRAAADAIRDRPLLGVGPENYQLVWSRFYHPEMHRFLEDSRWDRAHNAYLDAFATAGILGFLSLLAVWVALTWAANRGARRAAAADGGATSDEAAAIPDAIVLGFFVAYGFYLFFWFFDLNSAMLWIALSALAAGRASPKPLVEWGAPREKRWQTGIVLALGAIALVSVIYVHGYKTLEMARTLDRARDPHRPLHETLESFESVFASPAPVTQQAFLMYSAHLRSLQPRFAEIRSDPTRADLFDRAFVLAIRELESQGMQDPLNERVLVQHARVLMIGASYYRNTRLYESALSKLQHAVELAPRRITTRLVLGWAYLNINRPAEALNVFQRAYAVYPPLGRTQAYLATTYFALRDIEQAARWLSGALNAGHIPERGVVVEVARARAREGYPLEGAKLLTRYLLEKTGTHAMWLARAGAADAGDYEVANLAADLYAEAGDSRTALLLRRAARTLCSRQLRLDDLRSAGMVSAGTTVDCTEPWRVARSN